MTKYGHLGKKTFHARTRSKTSRHLEEFNRNTLKLREKWEQRKISRLLQRYHQKKIFLVKSQVMVPKDMFYVISAVES